MPILEIFLSYICSADRKGVEGVVFIEKLLLKVGRQPNVDCLYFYSSAYRFSVSIYSTFVSLSMTALLARVWSFFGFGFVLPAPERFPLNLWFFLLKV